MNIKNLGGKLQHKAYCEKHSLEQRAKVSYFPCNIGSHFWPIMIFHALNNISVQAETQEHGIEEFKRIKQIRVRIFSSKYFILL